MKLIFVLIFAFIIFFNCEAQIVSIKRDSIILIHKTLNTYPITFFDNPAHNYCFSDYYQNYRYSLNIMQNDTAYVKNYYYKSFMNSDSRRTFTHNNHLYNYQDIVEPCNNVGSLMAGSVNYLLFLLENRNK